MAGLDEDATPIVDAVSAHVGHACPRMDRHEAYVGVLISLWLAGLGIALVPIGVGAIGELAYTTQKLLSLCILVGASIALIGSILGPGPGRVLGRFQRRFEIRHAYLFGAAGLVAVDVGLGWFGYAVLSYGTAVGSATGAMTPILFVIYLKLTRKFWREYRRMAKEFASVKAAVVADEEPR